MAQVHNTRLFLTDELRSGLLHGGKIFDFANRFSRALKTICPRKSVEMENLLKKKIVFKLAGMQAQSTNPWEIEDGRAPMSCRNFASLRVGLSLEPRLRTIRVLSSRRWTSSTVIAKLRYHSYIKKLVGFLLVENFEGKCDLRVIEDGSHTATHTKTKTLHPLIIAPQVLTSNATLPSSLL